MQSPVFQKTAAPFKNTARKLKSDVFVNMSGLNDDTQQGSLKKSSWFPWVWAPNGKKLIKSIKYWQPYELNLQNTADYLENSPAKQSSAQ